MSFLLERYAKVFENADGENRFYRILNLFYYMKARRSNIKLLYSDLIYPATVTDVSMDFVRLFVPGFTETQERRAEIQFEQLNRFYQGSVLIQKANEEGVFIQFPQEIKFVQRRTYQRIELEDSWMRFIILYSPVLKKHEDEVYLENKYPRFILEILKDAPTLNVLLQMLIGEVEIITRDYSLNMVYNKEISELTTVESAVLKTKKIFFIADVSKLNSYNELPATEDYVNYRQYFELLKSEQGEYQSLLDLETIKKEDSRNFLVSYAMLPIRLFDRIIGYLRLETNQFEKHLISLSQLENLRLLTEIFSYGITKISINRSHFESHISRTRIMNLSITGLLMEIQDRAIYEYLQNNRRLKMLIPVGDDELEFNGEIIRFFPRDGAYYMGVMFFKSKPGDDFKLEQFLHSKLIERIKV